MRNLVKKLLSLLSIKVTLVNRKNELHQLGLNFRNSEIINNGEKIILKDFGLELNYDKHQYILKGLGFMYELKKYHNATFHLDRNSIFTVSLNNMKLYIQTYEELFILNEIYINGIYNVSDNHKFCLIDVGMNVGFTSLYFAQNSNCVNTYSFEPFKITYEQALANFSVNPSVKSKINAFNYGLGYEDKSLMVTYAEDIKGNMGIKGIPDYLSHQDQQVSTVEISIKGATEILSPIVENIKTQDHSIVLKMDCEGSEYDIFNSIKGTKILESINSMIVEWHVKGPEQILTMLEAAGFTCFSFSPDSSIAGMIYAVKK